MLLLVRKIPAFARAGAENACKWRYSTASTVTASIIVVSSACGFGLATTFLSAKETNPFDISNGPGIASPGAQTRQNVETRSIAGFKGIVLRSRSLSTVAYPAMNPDGPAPGLAHANLGVARGLVSSCLMAMNETNAL